MPNKRPQSRPSMPRIIFLRLGERLCLDFVNTLAHRLTDTPDESLPNYGSLMDWAWSMDVISASQFDSLVQFAVEAPDMADAVFKRSLTLRETLYRLFLAVASQRPPDAADLAQLHALYTDAIAHSRLVLSGRNYALSVDSAATPEMILWAVARSAVDLLTVEDLSRLKQCPGLDDCGFLFLDTSKNATRYWCSMDFCGSRAKMRRLYARKRRMRDPEVNNGVQ